MSRSIFYYILCLISTFSYIPVKSSVSCGDRDLIYTFTWNGRGWTPSGVLGYDCLPRQKKVSRRYHGPVEKPPGLLFRHMYKGIEDQWTIKLSSNWLDYYWLLRWILITMIKSVSLAKYFLDFRPIFDHFPIFRKRWLTLTAIMLTLESCDRVLNNFLRKFRSRENKIIGEIWSELILR